MSLTALEFVLRATGRATLIFFSHDCPPNVYGLPHYPVAQADAQTFPSSLILNEIDVPAAFAASYRWSEKGQILRDKCKIKGETPLNPIL
jgi:hypothetical protein